MGTPSEKFGVGVGVHQGSVLSPLLFIIVLEALSGEFRTGCPWELLYIDDLMISAGSKEELLVKVKTWKTEMEKKGIRVNMGKTKIMESGINLDVLKISGKYPCGQCGVCLTGVGSTNAILCDGCERWVHKKCSGIKGPLLPESEFTCARCLGTARAIDARQSLEVEVGKEKLEVVPQFCYLGDMPSVGGGCELAAITRYKCAWGKFRQLLSLLTKLGIQDLDVVLRIGRMRWFGHVECSTGWISEVHKLNVVAQKRASRPRKSWDEVIKNDRKKLDMDSADPQNRSEWRGRLRGRLVKKPNPR